MLYLTIGKKIRANTPPSVDTTDFMNNPGLGEGNTYGKSGLMVWNFALVKTLFLVLFFFYTKSNLLSVYLTLLIPCVAHGATL
jgi:hypothetical protein